MRARTRAILGRAGCLALFFCACVHAGGAKHEHPRPTVLAPGYADLEFEPPAAGTYKLPPLGVAGDGPILDSTGKRGRLRDLFGDKIVVLSFIYTTCNDVNGCPLASHVLRGVQNRLLEAKDLADRVRLLSFSFDPAQDTPEVLANYSGHFRKPAFDWRFLSCDNEEELSTTLDRFDQWVIRDYDDNGNYLGTISHNLRVYLIDRAMRIRNIYSVSFLHADTLLNDIRTLELEAATIETARPDRATTPSFASFRSRPVRELPSSTPARALVRASGFHASLEPGAPGRGR